MNERQYGVVVKRIGLYSLGAHPSIKAMSAKALCGVVGITSDCNIYCHPQVTSSTLVEGTVLLLAATADSAHR